MRWGHLPAARLGAIGDRRQRGEVRLCPGGTSRPKAGGASPRRRGFEDGPQPSAARVEHPGAGPRRAAVLGGGRHRADVGCAHDQ
ncbi:hypothetical protein ATKI12_4589 [Kitasatospora sp. Ki12]